MTTISAPPSGTPSATPIATPSPQRIPHRPPQHHPGNPLACNVQIAGAGAFIAGIVLSLHHYGNRHLLSIAGAAASFLGKKLRASWSQR